MADFNEVAEQLRKFSDELKDTLEVELTQEHFKFAQNLTRQAATRADAQKEFVKSLDEESLINRQLDLFKRKQAAVDTKKLATTIQETNALDQQIKGIDVMLSENETLLKTVDAQVVAWGIASGLAEELNLHQKRHQQIAIEVAAILQGQTDLTGQQREDRLAQLKVEENHVTLLEKGAKSLARQERINKSLIGDIKIFGKSFDDLREDLLAMLTTPGGIIKLVLAGVFLALVKINKVMQDILDTGLSVGQSFEATGQIIKVMTTGGIDNLLAWKDTAKAVMGLRGQFGDLRFQTDAMVENTQDLVTFFRLTGQEAALVTEILTKVGGLSAQQQDDFQKSARAFAKINDLNPAAVMRAVAQHARQFALAGADGANEFIRAQAAADRMGISLEKIEGIRDNVLDIDTLFKGVAELRTLGIDIPDPAVLAQAAQFEGPQGFVRELQRQLQATGRELSREGLGGTIQARRFEQLLGIDLADMNRILNEGATAFDDATQTQVDTQKDATEQLITGMGALLGSINMTTVALVAFTGFLIKGALAGGMTRGLGGGLGGAALGGMAKFARGGVIAGGIAGGAITTGVGAFGDIQRLRGKTQEEDARARGVGGLAGAGIGGAIGGMIGSFIAPGVGTALGISLGASLGGFVGRGVGDLIGNLFEDAPQTEVAEAKRAIEGEIPPSAVSDAALQLAATQQALTELQLREFQKVSDDATHAKIGELIDLFRSGAIAMNVDGTKLGQVVVNSFGSSAG